MKTRPTPAGFTLIELLVVVAIIALLIAILLPSLGAARANARAVKCGAQLRSVGQATAAYVAENDNSYPPSYWYPEANGTYEFFNQNASHPAGYSHWSSFLFAYSKDVKAFTCPEFEFGGLSRTNPGKIASNWIPGQTDQNGNSNPTNASVEDHQAPFVAFTGNAAILPRNKFTPDIAMADGGNGQRLNRFVKQTTVGNEGRTILATEFNINWRTITAVDPSNGNARVIKSHRPVNPFIGAGGGADEYSFSLNAFFIKTSLQDLYDTTQLNAHVAAGDSLITDRQTQLNAVGRHHPGRHSGSDGRSYGGSANFLYLDGHIERKNVAETLGEWGERYYSLNGNNFVR